MWASAFRVTATHGPKVVAVLSNVALVADTANALSGYAREWWPRKAERCPVCKEELDKNPDDLQNAVVPLPKCGHKYHFACLNHLKELQDICAVCEKDL